MSYPVDDVSGGGRKQRLGCKLKKVECKAKSTCVWVQGKGCRHESKVPQTILAKEAKKVAKPKTPTPKPKTQSPATPKSKTPAKKPVAKPKTKKPKAK